MTSISRQLTVGLLVGMALILGMVAAVGSLLVRHAGEEYFDDIVEDQARAHAGLVNVEDGAVLFDASPVTRPRLRPDDDREFLLVLRSDGSVLHRSETIAGGDPPILPQSIDGPPRFFDATLADGAHVRGVQLKFLAGNEAVTLVFLRETAELRRLFRVLTALGWSGALLALLLAAVLVRVVVRRSLVPLSRLADAASEIDESRLDRRFERATFPRELRPIVRCLNSLLERLEAAFGRERRFIDNVAHELMTPIAELRSSVTLARRWQDDPELVTRSLSDIDEVACHQERLIRVLLSITRADSRRHTLDVETLDLEQLVDDVLSSRLSSDEVTRLRIDSEGLTRPVHTDRAALTSIVTNLIANAEAHMPADAQAVVRLRQDTEASIVTVSNPAPDLRPEDLPSLFEPFWRKSQTPGEPQHLGLGLCLARSLAELVGARLEARLEGGHIAMILTLPRVLPRRDGRADSARTSAIP